MKKILIIVVAVVALLIGLGYFLGENE